MKALVKIPVEDERLNRLQDQLVAALNPVLRQLGTAPVVTGSRGANAALTSLIAALAKLGLITDQTTG